MKKQRGNTELPALILLISIVIVGFIWAFAWKNGIPFETMVRCVFSTAGALFVYIAWLFFTRMRYLRLTTCITALVIWPLWWPVLKALGSHLPPEFASWEGYGDEMAWYATAWARWGIEALIGLITAYVMWVYSETYRW